MKASFTVLFETSLLSLAAAQSFTEALSSATGLSLFADLLPSYPELLEALSSASNITVLAPANYALQTFLQTDEGERFSLDPEYAQALLSYHVLAGRYSSDWFENIEPSTLGGQFLRTLLLPGPYANVTGGQTVEGVPGSFEVIDQSNATFFSGFIDDSVWAQAELLDLEFDGGLIHGINPPLTLPPNVSTLLVAADRESLLGAIQRVGLLEALESRQDLTLFAPTNQAFQNIGSATPDLSDDDLRNLLLYHVAVTNGTFYGPRFTDGLRLPTLGGGELTITIQDDGSFTSETGVTTKEFQVFVNGARITNFNFAVQNGVVFGIDNVLNPSNTTAVPPPSATVGQRQFGAASAGTVFPFTEGVQTTDSPIFSATNPANTQPAPNTPTALASGGVEGASSGSASVTVLQQTQTGGVGDAMVTGMPVFGAVAAGAAAAWVGL